MENDPSQLTPKVPKGAYLVFNQTIIPITKQITNIGRKPENDLVIQEKSVSRFHARIRVQDGHFVLTDRNSHNGTFINDNKIKEVELEPGTLIYFGEAMVFFVQEDKRITESLEMDTGELKGK